MKRSATRPPAPSPANSNPYQPILPPLLAISFLYPFLIYQRARAHLWYDELLTYYIAKMPTLGQLVAAKKVDLNPLPEFILARLSMAVFGSGEFAVRLPSILAFYLASVLLFFYIRRKAGAAYAAFGILAVWSDSALGLATEARPYALIFLFFSLLLLCWDNATKSGRSAASVWGVAIATTGLLAVHALGVVSLLPFLAAEAIRFRERRKPDYLLWAALLLPMTVLLIYVPVFSSFSGVLYPVRFQGSFRNAAKFFYEIVLYGWGALIVALVFFFLPKPVPQGPAMTPDRIRTADLVVLGVLLVNPILLNLEFMRTHAAIWPRYYVTSTVAAFAALAILLAIRRRFEPRIGYLATAVLALVSLVVKVGNPAFQGTPRDAVEASLDRLNPDLPVVISSAVVFLEFDHYESDALTSRTYYLQDRDAAVKYSHATLFEDLEPPERLKLMFPIRSNVEAYTDFVREHPRFLVMESGNDPEEWVLRKLRDDSARTTLLGACTTSYKDRNVYLITMPER